MPDDNAVDTSNGRTSPPTLIQVAFPGQPTVVFAAAIVVGLLFIVMTSVFRSYFALNGVQANLVLCIGSALVLAAFGGQATVRVGGIIMAGAAALAFGLFLYLQASAQALAVQGSIHDFDFDTYKSIELLQKNTILGRIVQNNGNVKRSRYDFAIFKKELDSPLLEVVLTTKDATERVLHIDARMLESSFGESRRLEWRLQEKGDEHILALVDMASQAEIAREVVAGTAVSSAAPGGWHLITRAFAAEEPAAIDVPLMLKRLKADDATTRRAARNALAQAPAGSIPSIMETLHREGTNYQVKLGICVALAEMLRQDKSRAAGISAGLKERDLNKLLDAAGDRDRTVRVYAAEFLFDLGDPRMPKLAIPRAASTGDENGRYNWLLVSQDGWRKLSPKEKHVLAAPLQRAKDRSGKKTQRLFDKFTL